MSREEQDYINSLPIRSRPLAIYQLQAMECTQIRNFIQFLRGRGQPNFPVLLASNRQNGR